MFAAIVLFHDLDPILPHSGRPRHHPMVIVTIMCSRFIAGPVGGRTGLCFAGIRIDVVREQPLDLSQITFSSPISLEPRPPILLPLLPERQFSVPQAVSADEDSHSRLGMKMARLHPGGSRRPRGERNRKYGVRYPGPASACTCLPSRRAHAPRWPPAALQERPFSWQCIPGRRLYPFPSQAQRR